MNFHRLPRVHHRFVYTTVYSIHSSTIVVKSSHSILQLLIFSPNPSSLTPSFLLSIYLSIYFFTHKTHLHFYIPITPNAFPLETHTHTRKKRSIPRVSKHLRAEFARGDGRIKRKEDARRENILPNETLFVVNFHEETTRREDLEMLFQPYGELVRIDMKKNYAFVQFANIEQATAARNATNGGKLDQSAITVEFVAEKDRDHSGPPHSFSRGDRGGRGGGYRGGGGHRGGGGYHSNRRNHHDDYRSDSRGGDRHHDRDRDSGRGYSNRSRGGDRGSDYRSDRSRGGGGKFDRDDSYSSRSGRSGGDRYNSSSHHNNDDHSPRSSSYSNRGPSSRGYNRASSPERFGGGGGSRGRSRSRSRSPPTSSSRDMSYRGGGGGGRPSYNSSERSNNNYRDDDSMDRRSGGGPTSGGGGSSSRGGYDRDSGYGQNGGGGGQRNNNSFDRDGGGSDRGYNDSNDNSRRGTSNGRYERNSSGGSDHGYGRGGGSDRGYSRSEDRGSRSDDRGYGGRVNEPGDEENR